jgi:hypothetical protein
MKMKTYYLSFLLLTFTFGISHQAEAQRISKTGTAAGEFLKIPVGARSSVLSAMAANVDDPSAMFWNPAGLSNMTDPEIMLEYTDWFIDFQHSYLGGVMPLGKGTIGLHVLSFDAGEFDETTVEAGGKTGRTFRAYSISTGVSYSQRIIPEFTIGGTAKVVYERIYNSSAAALAFDFGTIYETPFDGILFGVSVTNIGSKLRMNGTNTIVRADLDESNPGIYDPDANLTTEEYNLPLTLRVGLSWDAYDNGETKATLSVDGTSPSNNFQSVSVGGEISFLDETVFLRGGLPYLGLPDKTEIFNAGIGFNYQASDDFGLKVNYGFYSYEYFSAVNKISLQIYF